MVRASVLCAHYYERCCVRVFECVCITVLLFMSSAMCRQVLRLTQKASGSGKLTNLSPLGAHPKRKTGLNSWTPTILSLIIIAYHWLSLIASASKKSPSVPCISALKLRPCHVNINIIGQIYNFWNLALINCQKLFAADSLFLFGSFLLCVLIWWSQFLITFCDFNAL